LPHPNTEFIHWSKLMAVVIQGLYGRKVEVSDQFFGT